MSWRAMLNEDGHYVYAVADDARAP